MKHEELENGKYYTVTGTSWKYIMLLEDKDYKSEDGYISSKGKCVEVKNRINKRGDFVLIYNDRKCLPSSQEEIEFLNEAYGIVTVPEVVEPYEPIKELENTLLHKFMTHGF